MTCYYPLDAWRAKSLNSNGKRGITFKRNDAFTDMPVKLACGQCIGCRLDRSRKWAIRCVHEAQMHEDNCFLTLTYDNDHLPQGSSLNLEDIQKFLKRLRKANEGKEIRFFQCGEYGEQLGRPHHHVLLFGHEFDDKKLWQTRDDYRLYVSSELQRLWPFGHSLIGSLTFESAAYLARYITKKINGDDAEEHYKGRKPEYITMSRRPGIGASWLEKYHSDVYPADRVVIRGGMQVKPPRYYDNLFEKIIDNGQKLMQDIRADRQKQAKDNELTAAELFARKEVQIAKFQKLIRGLENE